MLPLQRLATVYSTTTATTTTSLRDIIVLLFVALLTAALLSSVSCGIRFTPATTAGWTTSASLCVKAELSVLSDPRACPDCPPSRCVFEVDPSAIDNEERTQQWR